jgi:hypothetical protein
MNASKSLQLRAIGIEQQTRRCIFLVNIRTNTRLIFAFSGNLEERTEVGSTQTTLPSE